MLLGGGGGAGGSGRDSDLSGTVFAAGPGLRERERGGAEGDRGSVRRYARSGVVVIDRGGDRIELLRPPGVKGHRKLHRSGHRKLHTWRR